MTGEGMTGDATMNPALLATLEARRCTDAVNGTK
jgi:hypothetical protein